MHPQKHGLHKLCEHWCPRNIMTSSVLSTSLILKIDFWPENKETSKNTNVGKHWELIKVLEYIQRRWYWELLPDNVLVSTKIGTTLHAGGWQRSDLFTPDHPQLFHKLLLPLSKPENTGVIITHSHFYTTIEIHSYPNRHHKTSVTLTLFFAPIRILPIPTGQLWVLLFWKIKR